MICPNGHITISKLIQMVNSEDYAVYFEPNDEPADWDWRKNGVYHSPHRKPITSTVELHSALKEELNKKGTICYDYMPSYIYKHPFEGEAKTYVKEEFFWEYQSHYSKRCYKICKCSYLGEEPEHVPLEIVCFEGDFNSSCFQIGSWSRDKEGYEFHSCGSRLFENVDNEDLPVIWNAIHKADEFLAKRFKEESSS